MIRFPCIILSLFFVFVVGLSHASTLNTAAPPVEEQEELSEPVEILPADAVLLGQKEENGITAMAWLYRVPASSTSPENVKQFPYLLFLRFLSIENNILIEKGLVAYKLEDRAAVSTPAEKMEFKNGYFVSGIDSPGRYYALHIGCKMEDEKKRQFKFSFK